MKRDHKFEGQPGRIYRRIWREEKKGRTVIYIVISKKMKIINHICFYLYVYHRYMGRWMDSYIHRYIHRQIHRCIDM